MINEPGWAPSRPARGAVGEAPTGPMGEAPTGPAGRSTLSLSDVLKDLAGRGDRVFVEYGGHSFGGAVRAAGSDYASILGSGQAEDVRLDAARWSILPPGSPEPPWPDSPETFRGLLQKHSAEGTTVRLALPAGDLAVGKIAAVAVDHIEVEDVDQRKLAVPLDMVLAVIRSTASP